LTQGGMKWPQGMVICDCFLCLIQNNKFAEELWYLVIKEAPKRLKLIFKYVK
jgi:hypothetical protein